MIFSLDFTRERIYAVHTPMPKFPVHPESPHSRLHLSKCLTMIIKLMTYLKSLPPAAFTTFTFPEWYHIIDILVTLSRLCFPIPSIPSWDPTSTRQTVSYLPLVTGLQVKMGEVVKLLAEKALPFGGEVHEKEKGTINIPYLFSAVLTILLEQYNDRVSSFVDSPFNVLDAPTQDRHTTQNNTTFPDSQHAYATPPDSGIGGSGPKYNGALCDSIYPMKSGLCPVMNGALKGTEYWDAMGAFNRGIGGSGAFAGTWGDAWMGAPIGGEIFDGNVIEDWGLWDMQAGQWEGGYGGYGDDEYGT